MPSISLPVAMIGSAGINAASSLFGGSQAAGAAAHSSDIQRHMYETSRNDLMPYNEGGQADFAAANKLMTGSPSEIQAQLEGLPGYQFTKTQGLKAVQNSAAARGLGVSGASYKGAANFATGLADSTYGEQVNRLMQGATLGEHAAGQAAGAAAGMSKGIGEAITDTGAAQAAGTTGAAKSLGSGLLGFGMFGNGAAGGSTLASAPNDDLLALAGG